MSIVLMKVNIQLDDWAREIIGYESLVVKHVPVEVKVPVDRPYPVKGELFN